MSHSLAYLDDWVDDIDDERERLQVQASWRRKQVKEMRDSNQYAYWSQVRNSKDPWWEGF